MTEEKPKGKPRGRPFTKDNQPDPEKKVVGGVAVQEAKKVPKLLREIRTIIEAIRRPERLTPYQQRLWDLYEKDFLRFTQMHERLETTYMAGKAKTQEKAGPERTAQDEGADKARAILKEWLEKDREKR